MKVSVFDRKKGELREENIPAGGILSYVYSSGWLPSLLCKIFSKTSIISYPVTLWHHSRFSKKHISSFIKAHHVKIEDFDDEEYKSFNDFFVRRLKKGARPVEKADFVAPADGRYLVYQNTDAIGGIFVKGEIFSLGELLGSDPEFENRYSGGSMVIARLAPMDYHRFHFPVDGIPGKAKLINGVLYSVNPIALRQSIHYVTQNKRVLVEITSPIGKFLVIAVGATNVGSINFTYKEGEAYKKGDEMGYFSFGGSMLIILGERGPIAIDSDLLANTAKQIETLCQMGESIANRAV